MKITDYFKKWEAEEQKLEADEMRNRYLEKLNADEKMNTIFKYFKIPKNPIIFVLLMALVASITAHLMNSWILTVTLTVLTLFLMWNIWIAATEKKRIAERCAVEEAVMETQLLEEETQAELKDIFGTDAPFYITDEERDTIMLVYVLNYWNMTMIEKMKFHRVNLYLVTMLYFVVYVIVYAAIYVVKYFTTGN